MAIIYGTADDVAVLARVWTSNGAFVDPDPLSTPLVAGTNPTLTAVNNWISTISSQMNLALANHWFDLHGIVDGTDFNSKYPDVYEAIKQEVVSLVADLVNAANSAGRFFASERLMKSGRTQSKIIADDLDAWVDAYADGLSHMGLPQTMQTASQKQVYFRTMNDSDNSAYARYRIR